MAVNFHNLWIFETDTEADLPFPVPEASALRAEEFSYFSLFFALRVLDVFDLACYYFLCKFYPDG